MSDERFIQGLESLPAAVRGGVLTIGNFDGVHLGHRRILAKARAVAAGQALPVVALTFEPPPEMILKPPPVSHRIMLLDRKAKTLLENGADFVVAARTDRLLLGMTAIQFIQDVIVNRFAPRHMVEGDDFRFGLARQGNVQTLREAAGAAGFQVHEVSPMEEAVAGGPRRVSSTLVRQLLWDGRIGQANACLGGTFTLEGRVIPGEGRGRLLEFPTANLDCPQQIVPGDGIYVARATIEGTMVPSAVSIGNKPTFGPAATRSIEAFLIDANGDYYNRHMELAFFERLRDQRKFESAEALRQQIAKDVQRARELCG